MIMKQRLFYIYIIVFIIVINAFSKSVFPRADEPNANDNTEVAKTEVPPPNQETKTTPQPEKAEPTTIVASKTEPSKAEPTTIVASKTESGKAEPTSTESPNSSKKEDEKDNAYEPKKVTAHVESQYGSIDISYIPPEKKDKSYTHQLILYFSSVVAIFVLVCLVHTLVYIRPKIIEKRANKRRKRLREKKESSLLNIEYSENNSEVKIEEKIGNESPAASIEYTTSSFNASSTDCIINLDKNSSNIPINRGKSNDKKKL